MKGREVSERASIPLLAALVAAAVVAAFAPVLSNGVLNWDDLLFIGKDAHGWNRDGLRWAFGEFHLGQYVPLACLSHIADSDFWGANAGGYHLTSLLWHVAAGLLWFGFWLRLLTRPGAPGRKWDAAIAAAAAALLFCLHPLRVESVAWLAERRDVLCGFFYAAALRLYLESCLAGKNAERWRAGALACFALSLLSKAASVTLPATLLILDVYPLKRLPIDPRRWLRSPARRVLLEKIPFAMLSIAAVVGTIRALRRSRLIDGYAALNFSQRLACASYSVLFYVRKELWPFPMLPVYEMPLPFRPGAPRFLAWSAAAVVAVAAMWQLSRRRPALGAAASLYAVALLPVSGLVGGGLPHLGADRFSYFPSLGFSALAAAILTRSLARPWLRIASLAATAAILAALGTASWHRCLEWRSDESLWRAALAADPSLRGAHLNLAAALSRSGRPLEAAVQAEESARLDPANALVWENLGAARFSLSRWGQAVDAYGKAVVLKPGDSAARRGLGRALAAQGRGEAAAEQLRAAIILDPQDAVARYELGNALFRLGRMDPAADFFTEALKLDPKLAVAHANLGRVLEVQGLVDPAVEEYRAAVRLGGSPEALYNWANVESKRGRGEVSIRLYREALRLNPGFDDARFNWGNALARLGRLKEAADQYRLLLARRPGDVQARENLRRVSAR